MNTILLCITAACIGFPVGYFMAMAISEGAVMLSACGEMLANYIPEDYERG